MDNSEVLSHDGIVPFDVPRNKTKPDNRTTHVHNDVAVSSAKKLLDMCGFDTTRPGRERTAERMVRALMEMTKGYEQNPKEILSKQFEESSDEMVLLRNVEFTSLCEHHVLPFVGTVDVGYIPGTSGKVVGLSKLARLVDCYACRLQMQERMTREVATALMEHLSALGAMCVVRARHSCMGCRGVKKPESEMVTSCCLGVFRTDRAAREEFLMLCRGT